MDIEKEIDRIMQEMSEEEKQHAIRMFVKQKIASSKGGRAEKHFTAESKQRQKEGAARGGRIHLKNVEKKITVPRIRRMSDDWREREIAKCNAIIEANSQNA